MRTKFNRIIASSLLSIVSITSIYAAPMQMSNAQPELHSGFYIGGLLSHSNVYNESKYSATIPDGSNPAVTLNASIPKTGATLAVFNAMAGYQFIIKGFYLAAEGYAGTGSIKNNGDISGDVNASGDSDPKLAIHSSVKSRGISYGANLRLGHSIFSRTILYGLLGVNYNPVKFSGSGTLSDGTTTLANGAINSRNKTLVGFRYGLGIEQELISNLFIDFEYAHTQYGSANITSSINNTTAGPVPISFKNKISTNAFSLGLKYIF